MRCNNCGWTNPDQYTSCEKCGSQLGTVSPAVPARQATQATETSRPTVVFDHREPRPTVIEASPSASYTASAAHTPSSSAVYDDMPVVSCSACGYPILPASPKCPACGAPRPRLTVRPGMKGARVSQRGFKLVMLPEENDDFAPTELTFVGDSTVLNRSNTDPANLTITSREQAKVCFVDGKWLIENRSDMGTTYIQVNKPVELHPGDVIVLGDRRFEFQPPTD